MKDEAHPQQLVLYLQISYFSLSSGFFSLSRHSRQPSNPCVRLHQTAGERERKRERELHHPLEERGGEEERRERRGGMSSALRPVWWIVGLL